MAVDLPRPRPLKVRTDQGHDLTLPVFEKLNHQLGLISDSDFEF